MASKSVQELRRKKKESRKKSPAVTANKYYTEEQMAGILWAIKSMKGKRPDVYVYLMLCVYTGARRREILTMESRQVHSDGRVTIEGDKGSQDRTLDIPDKEFVEYLLEYTKNLSDEYLFDFYPKTATRYMKKMIPPSLKIQRPLHALRHFVAIQIYKRTRDLKFVQRFLGHVDVKNSAIYANAVDLQEYDTGDIWKDVA